MIPLLSRERATSILLSLSADPLVRPKLAQKLQPVLAAAFQEHDKKIIKKMNNANEKCSNCDEAGIAMFKFMDDIRAVARLPDSGAKARAWALTLELISNSSVDPEDGKGASGYGEDDDFKAVVGDKFALEIATARWNEGQAQEDMGDFWLDIDENITQLDEEAEYLSEYGVEPFFPKLRKQLHHWSQELSVKRSFVKQ